MNDRKIKLNAASRLIELDNEASALDFLPDNQCLENYNKILRESSAITTKDTPGSEVLLDAMVLGKASHVVCNKIKNIKIVECEFGWKELALKAKHRFQEPEVREELLACDIFGGHDQQFYFNSMMAQITNVKSESPVAVKQSRKRVRDVLMDPIEPEELKSPKKRTTDAPSRIFEVIMKVYTENGNQPINFYSLILNPNSFTATVENLFYTSFLFKDGFIKLNYDLAENPFIEPVVKNNQRQPENDTISTEIFSIKKSDWKDLLERLQIDSAMLPRLRE